MTTLKKYFMIFVSVISVLVCNSCESEDDFGFPSKINISGKGETLDIKGSNELPPGIIQIEVLDYNGDGNSNGLSLEGTNYIEATTDWLTVRYSSVEYKLVFIAKPNETSKNRKLYLYLLSGKSRQEITVTQSK